MRTVELAKVASAAEALRLRRIGHRQGMRVAFAAGAGVFVLAVFVLLHVLAYHLMVPRLSPVQACLILLAFDLIMGGILGFLAMRDRPDSVELEALAVRRQAVAEMRRSLTAMGLAAEIAGVVVRRGPQVVGSRGRTGHLRLLSEIAARVLARR